MMRSRIHFFALIAMLLCCGTAGAATVSIDTSSAKAFLNALENPAVTHQECLAVASMPGNQGMIRKGVEFRLPATTANFADALCDAAHNVKPHGIEEQFYFFDRVKPKVAALRLLIKRIEDDPEAFQVDIQRRIAMFSPPDLKLALQGYVVAGGDGGGYAFGGTDFYLNVAVFDEFTAAKISTTHELYHAVQGAFAKERGTTGDLPPLSGLPPSEQACLKSRQLFANLYEEGSATYVEDTALLQTSPSEIARLQQKDLEDGFRHVRWSMTLLEMSVIAFNSNMPLSFDDVYEVDFYGHGALYSAGLVMAKAIVEQESPQALAELLKRPAEEFILRYKALPLYGKDNQHPILGPHTLSIAEAMTKSCVGRAGRSR